MWQNRIVGEGTEAPDQLLANPNNWRIHPKHQQEALQGALREIGWIQRVIVNKRTGHVVDGHARVAIAISEGETEVPVLYVDLSEEEEKLALATLDPIAAMAATDQEMLDGILSELEVQDQGLQALVDELKTAEVNGKTDEDAVPEVQEEPKSKRGEVYQLGRHRLMCGDSTSEDDVARLMDGQKADMMFTDPPYGVAYVGKTKDALTIQNDNLTEGETSELILAAFGEAAKVLRPGAYVLATVPAGPLHLLFASDWKIRGWLRQIMVWVKDSMVLGHSEYHYKHEPILFGWVPGERYKSPDRKKTTVWEFKRPKASRLHPTMKPVEMWEYGIGNHTAERDSVYEPFLGSGSTLMACEKLNRTCYGMEIDEHYCDVIRKRWAEFVHGEGADWEKLTSKVT